MIARTPILGDKHYEMPSAFAPENLLREARRQKRIDGTRVPAVCVLDPDGDLVRQLERDGRTRLDRGWPCHHTDLHRVRDGELEIGIVGRAVGAPFAVLVAEQLFVSGCEFLISMTSAGQLVELAPPYPATVGCHVR